MLSEYGKTTQDSNACYDRLASAPRYAKLYEKLALGRVQASPVKLVDTDKVSEELIPLGLNWYAENQFCDQILLNGFVRISPGMGVMAAGWLQEATRIMHEAITEKPAYGSLNKEIAALRNRERQEIRQFYLTQNAKLNRQHADELEAQKRQINSAANTVATVALDSFLAAVVVLAARQSAMAAAQQSYLAASPVYAPPRQITATQCSRTSGVVTCTTY